MARKPKTQPSPDDRAAVPVTEPAVPDEAAVPARRGRKGQGRKPKQAAGEQVVPLTQDDSAAELQGQAPGQPEAEASLDLTRDDAPAAAAASQAETAAGSDPVQPDRDPVSLASEAAQSVPEGGTSVSAKPAARWDQATDTVEFDWPEIERVAVQGGPNQAVAKLLVAARAEGARSRWLF